MWPGETMRNILSGIIALLFVCLFSTTTKADTSLPILEYEYGNQIEGSYLIILENGVVKHRERSCCPPHYDVLAERTLTEAERTKLKASIDSAEKAGKDEMQGHPTSLGSPSGFLVVHAPSGTAV